MRPEAERLWVRYRDSLPPKSRADYSSRVRRFLEWAKDRPLNEKTALAYLEHLRAGGYADGTLRIMFALMSRFAKVNDLRWQFRRDQRPVVRESEVHNWALPPECVGEMVAICRGQKEPTYGTFWPTEAHTAFLCLSTVWWMRAIEMRLMTAEDIDFERRLLYIHTAKYGRQRYHMIPEFIVPYLEAHDFSRHYSASHVFAMFGALRRMIGYQPEIGWHGIRRAAVKEADKLGMTTAQKNIYGRWTVGSSQQAIRYSMAKTVDREGRVMAVGIEDQEIDEFVYTRHPFVQMWR